MEDGRFFEEFQEARWRYEREKEREKKRERERKAVKGVKRVQVGRKESETLVRAKEERPKRNVVPAEKLRKTLIIFITVSWEGAPLSLVPRFFGSLFNRALLHVLTRPPAHPAARAFVRYSACTLAFAC